MKRCSWSFSVVFLLGSAAAEEPAVAEENQAQPIPVYVAAYEFPPYYSSRMPKHFLGELIQVLNQRQDSYEFLIREVRPQDRYGAISESGCCDVIFFESEIWGWQPEMNYEASRPLIHGSDRMYSLQNEYWQPQAQDRVGGVIGYHYNFTQYQIDTGKSERDFMMYRADSQQTILTMLQKQRLQFALLTDEYVSWLQVEQPELVEGLYPAPEADGSYMTQIIFSQNSAIPRAELMLLIDELVSEAEVRQGLTRYSLTLVEDEPSGTQTAPGARQIE